MRIPGKENSKLRGARSAHPIISIIKWTRNSKLSRNHSRSTSTKSEEVIQLEGGGKAEQLSSSPPGDWAVLM
jgi:hypothetical protein